MTLKIVASSSAPRFSHQKFNQPARQPDRAGLSVAGFARQRRLAMPVHRLRPPAAPDSRPNKRRDEADKRPPTGDAPLPPGL